MKVYYQFFLLLAIIQKFRWMFADNCILNVKQQHPEPLLLSTENETILYPIPPSSGVVLNSGDSFLLACPGGTLRSHTGSLAISEQTIVTATCISGQTLNIQYEEVNFHTISCSINALSSARYTNKSCELRGEEVEIGFDLNDGSFARVIQLCFDKDQQNTLYSHHMITAAIGDAEFNVPRPNFSEDHFYRTGPQCVNTLYSRNTQRRTINALLGLDMSSTNYIQNNDKFFLSRGHLTAKGDFYYGPQQQATFHCVNIAPQWQIFNENNWNTIEIQVRNYADRHKVNLEVYTGTYGVATLPHSQTGEDTELFLYISGRTVGIPVPKLYWKVVYDADSKRGIGLVGVNNPFVTNVDKNIICHDVSRNIEWISWSVRDNLSFGYIYACDVDELRRFVGQVPYFIVKGILE